MERVKFLRRTFEKSKYIIYNSRNLILNANFQMTLWQTEIYNSRNLILNANLGGVQQYGFLRSFAIDT